ncbi:hypothetical protein C7N43_08285 [Sphingobacteriales bacterium UPWRP_1]|nr:hypothetical protein B6N25_11220 [Sphingobacteriales bacterium TSM_CSS]PSJ77552.1 hypothetical protein C7N43_08285 [Sphingobacteriales bacterium UPWRP_1]
MKLQLYNRCPKTQLRQTSFSPFNKRWQTTENMVVQKKHLANIVAHIKFCNFAGKSCNLFL